MGLNAVDAVLFKCAPNEPIWISTDESSDVHIRQKRVINLRNERDGPLHIRGVPYVVQILKDNITVCAGTILSAVYILTHRSCVLASQMGRYTVLSGTVTRYNGTIHTFRGKILVVPNPRLALYEVLPRIDFQQSLNRPIDLFLGRVPDPAYGIFSGWGCTIPGPLDHDPVFPEELKQTRLFIIPLAECIRRYQGRAIISDRSICTLDETKRRGTCIDDVGGPLVLRLPPRYVHQLLGIMSEQRAEEFGIDPDVFINLNRQEIHHWIIHAIQNQNHPFN
ncbi:trypsin-like [Belonocnema kinseyi]|uniref:trypsin-like n=1 Tax=Belonocnema kinseyi TaxID=2817044 RepID=UPI00143D4A13|nr:trypsin-like [Belonocnema kinseyi]